MPSWTSAPLAMLVLAAIAAPAVADDCVEPAVARSTGGRPCGDLSASMGRAELWRAPGFTDLRVSVLRIGFYDNDAARRATSFEFGSWEAIGDDDGLQAPAELGARMALHLVALRRQVDRDAWGAYVAADLLSHWYGGLRAVTPRLGARLGQMDGAALVVEARLAGAFAVGDYDRWSMTRDLDVGARAFASVSRRWRLEARGRYRDLTASDGYHLRDVTGAIGLGVEASPPGPRSLPRDDRWRVVTLFVGVAARRASELTPDAPAARARAATRADAPWQVLLWLDLDTTIDSDRRVW